MKHTSSKTSNLIGLAGKHNAFIGESGIGPEILFSIISFFVFVVGKTIDVGIPTHIFGLGLGDTFQEFHTCTALPGLKMYFQSITLLWMRFKETICTMK